MGQNKAKKLNSTWIPVLGTIIVALIAALLNPEFIKLLISTTPGIQPSAIISATNLPVISSYTDTPMPSLLPTQSPKITIEEPKGIVNSVEFEVSGTHSGLSEDSRIWVFIGQFLSGEVRYWIQRSPVIIRKDGQWYTMAFSDSQDIGGNLEIVVLVINDKNSNSFLETYIVNSNIFAFPAIPEQDSAILSESVLVRRVENVPTPTASVHATPSFTQAPLPSNPTKVNIFPPSPTLQPTSTNSP